MTAKLRIQRILLWIFIIFSRFLISVFLLASVVYPSCADFFPDDEDDVIFPYVQGHDRIRRFIRVFSRKPGPDAEVETRIGLKNHFKNLLRGGTVNIKLRIPHMDKIGKIPFFKEFAEDDLDAKKEFDIADKRDFEMVGRNAEDYGHLINPRIKKDP